jgi:hypothetical protein
MSQLPEITDLRIRGNGETETRYQPQRTYAILHAVALQWLRPS